MITSNAIHQQASRLVDPATYQTMLTNDPSLDQSDTEATYSCTVENIGGESSGTRGV